MKNKVVITVFIIMFLIGGCQKSSDQFLSFQGFTTTVGFPISNQLTEGDFFAKNLAVTAENSFETLDPALSSGATLLVNTDINEITYADHIFEKRYPASLTKLVTALVVLKYAELTDKVTFSYNASHIPVPGAKVCGFSEGDTVTMDTLLHFLLIYSGNDAAIAIAEHIAGSEQAFADIMNEEAHRLGAVQSNFTNSHGLHDDNQYTTAYDMYLIFSELMIYDKFISIINMPSYTGTYVTNQGVPKQKTLKSTNLYFTGDARIAEGISITGGKTGTTSKAGNCLILSYKDSNDINYISLILKANGNDRLYSQMSHLMSIASVQ